MKLETLERVDNTWGDVDGVYEGIKQLDTVFGRQWVFHIDLNILAMEDAEVCILGQLGQRFEEIEYMRYNKAAERLKTIGVDFFDWDIIDSTVWVPVIIELRRNRQSIAHRGLKGVKKATKQLVDA